MAALAASENTLLGYANHMVKAKANKTTNQGNELKRAT